MAASLTFSPLISSSPISSDRPKPKPDSNSTGSFSNSRTINELKQLHCDLTKKGLNNTLADITELVLKLAEVGTSESLDYARRAFEVYKEEEESLGTQFMYNSLIRGYSSSGLGYESISVYVEMVSMGFSPDKYTFPFVLSGCSKVEAFSQGVQIHGVLVKMGFEGDVFVGNSLIHFYAECGDLDGARKVFDEMRERNLVSWTSLICGYARREFPRKAVSLFFEMVGAGERPNSVTMVCVISACSKLDDLALCERIRGYVEDSGVKVNDFVVNALIDMYFKCGDFDAATRLFESQTEKSVVLCNTMMSNYVHRGRCEEALAIFGEMQRWGPRPDRITLLAAVSGCSQLGESGFGKCCHSYALRNGFERWDSISNALIDMYMKFGDNETALEVFNQMTNKTVVSWNSVVAGLIRNGDSESAWGIFNEMPEKDLVSWNTMISGLVEESRFEEAVELFREMQRKGVRADQVTMMEVTSACGYLGALDIAKWIDTYIRKYDIPCDMILGTALVDMFARCGDAQTAMRVFDAMPKRDVMAWTAAIGAMSMEGNGDRAIELFGEMVRGGVKPDGVVFVAALTACSHGGSVERGRKIFETMKDCYGIAPEIVHYGCMVDMLGRAGMLKEARDLIETMPMEPNDVIWGSFVAACRTHKNVEMADYAAERIKEFPSERTGIQVLMSNIYASAGRWNDVARVRLRLKEQGIAKAPGTSSIEVDGAIHEFTSGDNSHPKKIDIESMLDEIKQRLADAGHVPDLADVLLDVDAREKEYLLGRHSEKLAVAFGLISTGKGRPIRVVKNLRMCSDCHSFVKLVSRIYDREIVVRDNRRFHFFRQGVCSCGDYW